MPMFNFQSRFAPLVESGAKTQTIRKTCRAKVGDTLYLYTGARTKACRKLGEGRCTEVAQVQIVEYGVVIYCSTLVGVSAMWFASEDGFADFVEMREWFAKQHGLPFSGYLYKWELRV